MKINVIENSSFFIDLTFSEENREKDRLYTNLEV